MLRADSPASGNKRDATRAERAQSGAQRNGAAMAASQRRSALVLLAPNMLQTSSEYALAGGWSRPIRRARSARRGRARRGGAGGAQVRRVRRGTFMTTPIIFVHGAFCGGWAFAQFREPFEAAGFETHAPSLPFHGRGADLERLAQSGVKDYADAIVALARSLNGPPVLVGHSLGGLVAQLAATRMECAGLILLAPSSPWGVPPTTLDETANALGVTLLGDYWRRPIPPDYPTARRTTLDRLSRADARDAFARFCPESGRVIFETLHWALDHTMSSAAPPFRISAPLLGLAGERDHLNPGTTVRRVINRFPVEQADFEELPNMSHWLIGEPEWPLVANTSLEWLAARGVRPSAVRAARKKALKLLPWSAGAAG
jgi:pimeloyl-ACP methyl ester carboxylesterase